MKHPYTQQSTASGKSRPVVGPITKVTGSDWYFIVHSESGDHILLITAPTTLRVLRELVSAKERGITKADVFAVTRCLGSQIKQLKKYGLNIQAIHGSRGAGYDTRYVLESRVTMRKR